MGTFATCGDDALRVCFQWESRPSMDIASRAVHDPLLTFALPVEDYRRRPRRRFLHNQDPRLTSWRSMVVYCFKCGRLSFGSEDLTVLINGGVM